MTESRSGALGAARARKWSAARVRRWSAARVRGGSGPRGRGVKRARRWRGPRSLLAAGALATVAALGVVGCASSGAVPRGPYAELQVDNDGPSIVTVYAIRGGSRMRMGTVSGVSTATFPIRSHMMESTGLLRVVVEPLGSNARYFSDPILVSEGDVIQLTVSALVR